MVVLYIVGGLAALYLLLENRTNTSAGSIPGFETLQPNTITPTISNMTNVQAAGIAGEAATVATSTAANAGEIAAGAVPIIGGAISAVTKIVSGLLQAHDARVKGATQENKIVAAMVPIQRNNCQAILNAVSNGQMTPAQGIAAIQQVELAFWSNLPPAGPGIAGTRARSGCSTAPLAQWPGTVYGAPGGCGKTCTVGCCVGCTWIVNSTNKVIGMLQGNLTSPQTLASIPGDQYNMPTFPAVTLTYKAPVLSGISIFGISL